MKDNQFSGMTMDPAVSRWNSKGPVRNFTESTHSAFKIQKQSQPSGGRKEGHPSNILWVGYPPSVQVDEQMLHRAMILFGEIEKIKSFPSRFYSFVEFRSIDEARRAKEGLQGRLFNDPRITINYSSSDLAPGKGYSSSYSGVKLPKPDSSANDVTLRPAKMDSFSHNRRAVPSSFPGQLTPHVVQGANIPDHNFPQGGFEPLLPRPEVIDFANSTALMGPKWRRPSPLAHGTLPPISGIVPPISKPNSSAWNVPDATQFQRDSKRPRIDGGFPNDNTPHFSKKLADKGFFLEQSNRPDMQLEQVASVSSPIISRKNLNPADARVVTGRSVCGHLDNDYNWRGIIAKGGSVVCNARCIPIGKGLESEISEVVNCFARTGLEMLAKHFAEAIGFDIVFFLPDSEVDFSAYTEFLRYLGDKNRAGVAKLDDGTTLFLVPPSDFLTQVLKFSGPERLYGVVLKMPESQPDNAPILPQPNRSIPSSLYVRRQAPFQNELNVVTQEEQRSPLDHNTSTLNSQIDSKSVHPHDYPSTLNGRAGAGAGAVSSSLAGIGITFTPELIASLASLIPANTKSPLPPPTVRPGFTPDKTLLPHAWKQEHEEPDKRGYPSEKDTGVLPHEWREEYDGIKQASSYPPSNRINSQTGGQLNHPGNRLQAETQLPPVYRNYSAVPNVPSHSGQYTFPNAKIHDPTAFAKSSESGHLPVQRHHQPEGHNNSQRGFTMAARTETTGGFYGSGILQQSESKVQHSLSQAPTTAMPTQENPELLTGNNIQQLQSALYGAGQGAAEIEADKNQRYQSTLQFAANLLLQIQQKQQELPPTRQGLGDKQ